MESLSYGGGAECWPIKQPQIHMIMVAEMQMIQWMRGSTRLDRLRNEVIRAKTGVGPI